MAWLSLLLEWPVRCKWLNLWPCRTYGPKPVLNPPPQDEPPALFAESSSGPRELPDDHVAPHADVSETDRMAGVVFTTDNEEVVGRANPRKVGEFYKQASATLEVSFNRLLRLHALPAPPSDFRTLVDRACVANRLSDVAP